MIETWLPVAGYEGLYEVSTEGNVRSLLTGKILQAGYSGKRVPSVCLSKNGKQTTKAVHRLVAKAFLPNPHNKPQINHIDGNRDNRSVTNLEWATQHENMIHAYRIGLRYGKKGEKNPNALLSSKKVLRIRELRSQGKAYPEIGRIIGVEAGTVANVILGRSWSHVQSFPKAA